MSRDLTYKQYYNMCGDEFQDGDRIAVKLVCVLGYGGDYAIYLGTTDMTDDQVARNGDKLYSDSGDEVGMALFPNAVYDKHYRGS